MMLSAFHLPCSEALYSGLEEVPLVQAFHSSGLWESPSQGWLDSESLLVLVGPKLRQHRVLTLSEVVEHSALH